jgi:hypothetical protein
MCAIIWPVGRRTRRTSRGRMERIPCTGGGRWALTIYRTGQVELGTKLGKRRAGCVHCFGHSKVVRGGFGYRILAGFYRLATAYCRLAVGFYRLLPHITASCRIMICWEMEWWSIGVLRGSGVGKGVESGVSREKVRIFTRNFTKVRESSHRSGPWLRDVTHFYG